MSKDFLTLDQISVRNGDVQVLAGVSVDLRQGAPTILMGPNGAGKTTLLKVMAGFIRPTGGTVKTLAQRMSFVFQKPTMLRRSVADNVAFAMTHAGKASDRKAVEQALEQVGLLPLADRPARRLSGGEQQRLAVARALVRDPEIVFLDEPTASLDPRQTKALEDIVADAARRGVKVIMSTHDIGEAKRLAGDVIFLVGGRLVEHSPAAKFFTEPGSQAARQFLAGEIVI